MVIIALRKKPSMNPLELFNFVKESNQIEGILQEPTDDECIAAEIFLKQRELVVQDLLNFVTVYQPDAVLRDQPGLDVRVGNHYPPRGGIIIKTILYDILKMVSDFKYSPYEAHVLYETLHPFTDCNGRSGRILWLWMMERRQQYIPARGFLHSFYYQALDGSRVGK